MKRKQKKSLQSQGHDMMVHHARSNRKKRKRAGVPDVRDYQPVGTNRSISRRRRERLRQRRKGINRPFASTGIFTQTALGFALEQAKIE